MNEFLEFWARLRAPLTQSPIGDYGPYVFLVAVFVTLALVSDRVVVPYLERRFGENVPGTIKLIQSTLGSLQAGILSAGFAVGTTAEYQEAFIGLVVAGAVAIARKAWSELTSGGGGPKPPMSAVLVFLTVSCSSQTTAVAPAAEELACLAQANADKVRRYRRCGDDVSGGCATDAIVDTYVEEIEKCFEV